MYILGLHHDTDTGAVLLKDGQAVFAINEERLSRVKLDESFPERSIQATLAYAGITLSDIDVVSFGWHSGFPYEEHLTGYVSRCVDIAEGSAEAKKIMLERVAVEISQDVPKKRFFDEQMKRLGLTAKMEYFDHHRSHASCAFYPSPFDEALVVTLDARGNFRSGAVFHGKGSEMKEISCNYSFDSLGFLYGQITDYLGFKPHRHEGKITGLAAYGDPEKCLPIMREMIKVKDGKIYGVIGKYYKPFYTQHLVALKQALAPHSREDIAAAVQRHLEDVTCEYIEYYVKTTGLTKIAAAGGVFANVKLNQRIRAIPGVEDLYVFPQMGDGGLAMGAALLSWHARSAERKALANVYLGPEWTNGQIEEAVAKHTGKLQITQFASNQECAGRVVELLKKDSIIGLFQGRMEYGPRALGNRTILYHANDRSVNDWLNKRLNRTEFMPFAPVTIKELAPRCFMGWKPEHVTTTFMTECYDCTDEMKQNAPAVVHVDGTARPQIIAREDNPFYYDVIKGWNAATGGLCLINTSFNEHEHPIVCSIDDALNSLLGNNVDCVVANGRYLIQPI